MNSNPFPELLQGGDRRSIGEANKIASLIQSQKSFDQLWDCVSHNDRLVVMRAADALEKVTINNPQFLQKHASELLLLASQATYIELKWHLALMLPRVQFTQEEWLKAWNLLRQWAEDSKASKIVRVNALEGLHQLLKQSHGHKLKKSFQALLNDIEKEGIPSLKARIRKLQNNEK